MAKCNLKVCQIIQVIQIVQNCFLIFCLKSRNCNQATELFEWVFLCLTEHSIYTLGKMKIMDQEKFK